MKTSNHLFRGVSAFASLSLTTASCIFGAQNRRVASWLFGCKLQFGREERRLASAFVAMLLFACAPRAEASFLDGMVGQYTFDGNADNNVSSLYNGVVYGATLTTDRFGNANSAYAFSGFGQYIELSGSAALNFQAGFTLTAWARFDSAVSTGERMIIAKHLGGFENGYFLGSVNAQNYPTFFVNSDPRLVGSNSSNDGQWHSIVGVYDGTSQKLYFDGLLIESSAAPSLTLTNNTPITVGRSYPAASGYTPEEAARYFGGAIDDVRIYGRALSGTEISSLYALESTSAIPEPADYAVGMSLAAAGVVLFRRRERRNLGQRTGATRPGEEPEENEGERRDCLRVSA